MMEWMRTPIRSRVARSVLVVAVLFGGLALRGLTWATPPVPEAASRLALRYAEAMASGDFVTWAALDLGCLTRRMAKTPKGESPEACWTDTLAAHRDLLAAEPERGIFGAQGRGAGFGLLHESHRTADLWRDYPPAIFFSPAAWQQPGGPRPTVQFLRSLPARVTGLQAPVLRRPAPVRVTLVELLVTYPDPLTAPLALRPGEPWWASGTLRRYGPVRDLIVRLPVVAGLTALGYPVDRAVLSAGLPEAPRLLGPHPSGSTEIGRSAGLPGQEKAGQELGGGLKLGSVRWWDRASAQRAFATELRNVKRLTPSPERLTRLLRLLLLDDTDRELNQLVGDELYANLLKAGLTKSGISGGDEQTRSRLAELYWTLQAPTWRQELTEVAVGQSEVAEALYRALQAYEVVMKTGTPDLETMRRLGVLHRWNNESEAALELHEGALRRLSPHESEWRALLLGELAWDRLQWLVWTRRYDHPWLAQARSEAEEAVALAAAPVDKLVAAEAVLVVETLAVPRQAERMATSLAAVRRWQEQLTGVYGLWPHLVGNDLVKAFTAEGTIVGLPQTTRSPEVADVRVHASPPPQDLLRTWEFDQDPPGRVPSGFTPEATSSTGTERWTVQLDPLAPSLPKVLAHEAGCVASDCFEVLWTTATGFSYPDVTVHLRVIAGSDGGAGLALGAPDLRLYYAVTLNETSGIVSIHRITEGQAILLDKASVRLARRPWHVVRVQRNNFAHVSRARLAVFVDGREVVAVSDDAIPTMDRIGLVTRGAVRAQFDRLHVLNLVSNQPVSAPAAY